MKVPPIALVLLFLLSPGAVYAQIPALLTLDAQGIDSRICRIGVGFEYYRKATAPSPGFPVSSFRIGVATFEWSVARNVSFDLLWRGGLVARLDGGTRARDWGDISIGTRIVVLQENAITPVLGFGTSVKLPNTRYLPHRLGSNQTDFSGTVFAGKSWEAATLGANVGFSILGDPRTAASQDDTYFMSVDLLLDVADSVKVFVEGFGFTGYQSDDDKLLLRGGLMLGVAGIDVRGYGAVRIAGSRRDFGTAFEGSQDWNVGLMVYKTFTAEP